MNMALARLEASDGPQAREVESRRVTVLPVLQSGARAERLVGAVGCGTATETRCTQITLFGCTRGPGPRQSICGLTRRGPGAGDAWVLGWLDRCALPAACVPSAGMVGAGPPGN